VTLDVNVTRNLPIARLEPYILRQALPYPSAAIASLADYSSRCLPSPPHDVDVMMGFQGSLLKHEGNMALNGVAVTSQESVYFTQLVYRSCCMGASHGL